MITWQTIQTSLFIFLGICAIVSFIVLAATGQLKKLWKIIVALIPAAVAIIAALIGLSINSKKPGGKDEKNIDAPITSDDLTKPIGSGGDKSGRGKSNSEIIDTIERNTTDNGHPKKPY
jgi:hypothetical protein